MARPSKKLAGRPKDIQKKQAILQAAKEHFMRSGFEGVSMDAIAEAAGVSKLTVYSHFGNKDQLFKTVIAEKCREFNLNQEYDSLARMPMRKGLLTIAESFLRLVFSDDGINLTRVVITESAEKPKISKLVYEAGPEPSKARMAEYLGLLAAQKTLHIPDTRSATEHFFTLLKGEMFFLVLMNLQKMPNQKILKAHAEECVDLFIRAYAPAPKASRASAKK